MARPQGFGGERQDLCLPERRGRALHSFPSNFHTQVATCSSRAAARLPWHRSEPPEIPKAAVGEIETAPRRSISGAVRACFPSGFPSAVFRVTGLDLLPEAIAMA